MSLKYLADDDQPREKFLLKGKNALSDSELLAVILGSGNRNESAVELSRRILESVGNNWHQLSLLSISDLMKFNGIGEAKAISVAVALEIGRRRATQEIPERAQIKSADDVFKILHPVMGDLRTEEFWVIYVNQNNKVLYKERISQGGISGTIVDVRLIMKTAIEQMATGIFIAHNHPSGNLRPSQEDIKMTKQIHEAGKIMNITLIDHLIITQDSFYSFANENLI